MQKERIRQIAAITLATLCITGLVHWQLSLNHLQAQYLDVTRKASLFRTHIEYGISRSFLFLEDVAHFISIAPDITETQFRSYAAQISRDKILLKNIAAAPDLVIRWVYPREGNESIIGKAYRDLPGQWPDVQKAVADRKLVTAGPLNLIQGGTGLIGRVPVYVQDTTPGRLWGIVSSVVDMEHLYETAGMNASGVSISLRKTGEMSRVFYGDSSVFSAQARAVILPVKVPDAAWELAAIPKDGWTQVSATIIGVDLALILLGLIVGLLRIKSLTRNHVYMEIRRSLDMSQALSHLGSWSLNLKTDALWWSDETYRIFGLEKTEQAPTLDVVKSMIDPKDRTQVENAIDQSIVECGHYVIEHRIIRANGERAHVEARGFVHCGPDGTAQKFTGTILDITPRKKAEDEIRASQEQMSAMARASHDALIMIDSQGDILFWSDMAEKIFGWTADEAIGQSMHQLITLPEDCEKATTGLKRFTKTGTGPVIGSVMEFEAVRKDGSILPVERSVAAFKIGEAHYAVGSIRDISDRKKKEEQLRFLATTDSLTGLNNRRQFMDLIQKELKRCQRYALPVSVIMFDADKFKRVNDTFGHDAGDRVLADISRVTGQVIRETDFAGRLGGEEFAVGLPQTDMEGAVHLAHRLKEAFEASAVNAEDSTPIRYTASFGVACCLPDTLIDVKTLMKQADTALYRAKENGRNRVESHRPEILPDK